MLLQLMLNTLSCHQTNAFQAVLIAVFLSTPCQGTWHVCSPGLVFTAQMHQHTFCEPVLVLTSCPSLQVAAGACVLQLQLPNHLLADMTERAAMLQASQQADPYDVQLLQAAMDRLARAAVAAAV
jgi:hypothetical protein